MGKKIQALCVVAHPDDETIWMGGTILKNKDWDWTILSLCRKDDPDRAPKFRKVCNKLNAKPLISDLDDESDEPLSISGITEMIKQNLSQREYDHVFTHGENGEYGHIRHVGVHEAMKKLIKESEIKCGKLWFFDYVPGKEKSMHDQETIIPVPNKKSEWVVSLTKDEHEQKVNLIVKSYGFASKTFESQACAKQEAFTRK